LWSTPCSCHVSSSHGCFPQGGAIWLTSPKFTRSDNYINKYHKEFCDTHGLDLHSTIPRGFHGDGAPFQKSHHKQSSTEVYSWNFLVDRTGKRYLCTYISKDFMVHHNQETAYKLLEVFKWSILSRFMAIGPPRGMMAHLARMVRRAGLGELAHLWGSMVCCSRPGGTGLGTKLSSSSHNGTASASVGDASALSMLVTCATRSLE